MTNILYNNSTFLVDFCSNCIFHSVDYIYTFVNYELMIKISFLTLFLDSLFYNDNLNLFEYCFKFINNGVSNWSLFSSVYLNKFFNSSNFSLNTAALYYLKFHNTSAGVLFFYCPEIFNIIDLNLKNSYVSKQYIKLVIQNENIMETAIIFVMWYIQLILIVVLLYVFISYVSNYRSDNQEKTIDQDNLLLSTSLDSEEEISGVEDLLLAFFNFFYVFIWFFLGYFWGYVTKHPLLLAFIWFLPWMIFTTIMVPFNFLYNFGTAFSSFLRGSAASSVFTFEILFDIIVSVALFIRLVIQGVRLLLILFVYCSFYDMLLYWNWQNRWFWSNEELWKDVFSFDPSFIGLSTTIFLKIPFLIVYFSFEVFHMFFVITAQFFAFIGMSFWLYFFLYTYFTFDPMEDYLFAKRSFYKLKYIIRNIKRQHFTF